MRNKISKTEAKEKIDEFFLDIKDKSTKQVKKIKNLAMSKNIPLKEKRKTFCKKCLTPYSGTEKIRIKNKQKQIQCKNCEYVNKWNLK